MRKIKNNIKENTLVKNQKNISDNLFVFWTIFAWFLIASPFVAWLIVDIWIVTDWFLFALYPFSALMFLSTAIGIMMIIIRNKFIDREIKANKSNQLVS